MKTPKCHLCFRPLTEAYFLQIQHEWCKNCGMCENCWKFYTNDLSINNTSLFVCEGCTYEKLFGNPGTTPIFTATPHWLLSTKRK